MAAQFNRWTVLFAIALLLNTLFIFFTYTQTGHEMMTSYSVSAPCPTCRVCQKREKKVSSKSKATTQKFTFSDSTIINHFNFSYPINVQKACEHGKVEVLIPVNSAANNFERRNVTRHSNQGLYAKDKSNNVTLLFFVALPSNKTANWRQIQENLEKESAEYGDIVQINVIETYHNIVYKAIGVLHWVSTFCLESKFVLKTDDDVELDTPYFILSLYRIRDKYPNFIVGDLLENKRPNRNPKSKWYVSWEYYPDKRFPTYIHGPVFGYSTFTGYLIYQQALRTKLVWIDDVFLTGTLTKILGIPLLNDAKYNVRSVHVNVKTPKYVYYE